VFGGLRSYFFEIVILSDRTLFVHAVKELRKGVEGPAVVFATPNSRVTYEFVDPSSACV
jgi:hypothetical protein